MVGGGREKGVGEGRGERSGALPEAERRRAPNQPKRVFLPLVYARLGRNGRAEGRARGRYDT